MGDPGGSQRGHHLEHPLLPSSRTAFLVTMMCQVPNVSTSGLLRVQEAPATQRVAEDARTRQTSPESHVGGLLPVTAASGRGSGTTVHLARKQEDHRRAAAPTIASTTGYAHPSVLVGETPMYERCSPYVDTGREVAETQAEENDHALDESHDEPEYD